MQIKKEVVEKNILKAAQSEFQEKSFANASMRSIAGTADVTTSNIYNYFKNKDDIFNRLLAPVIRKIEAGKTAFLVFENHEKGNDHEGARLKEHREFIQPIAEFIYAYRAELRLLIFQSRGSCLEKYPDQQIAWFSDALKNSFYQHAKECVDEFLVTITASIWVNSLKEILKDDLGLDRIIKISEDLMTFIYMGWQGMVHSNTDK